MTNAYIAIDKPKDTKYENEFFKIADYAEKLTCFKNVTVISRTENWGYINNFRDILEYVFEEYDSLIYTEDDNIFSPSFLEYMNECLNIFKDDNRIASIQALSKSPIKTENNIYLNAGMSFWGMGIWKNKWNRILKYLNYDYFREITYSPRKLFLIWMRSKRRLQNLYVCYVLQVEFYCMIAH